MNYKVKTRKVAYIELNEAEITKGIEESIQFSSCHNQEPATQYVKFLLFGTNLELDRTIDNFISSFSLWRLLKPTPSIDTYVYQTIDNGRSNFPVDNIVFLNYLKFKNSVTGPILEMRKRIREEVGPDTIIHFKFI